MSKFIRLTESLNRGEVKKLLLRKDQISHVQEGIGGNDCHIRMIAGNGNADARHTYYFVKESFDQIEKMLMDETDYSKPPIIMNAEEALKYQAKFKG